MVETHTARAQSELPEDCVDTGTMAAMPMENRMASSGEEHAALPRPPEQCKKAEREEMDGRAPEVVELEGAIVEAEPISICVCSSSAQSAVQALVTHLQTGAMKDYVGKVDFMHLPYNDLDSFRPNWSNYSAVILCHSIYNRRFAVTDVKDALYDKFLPRATSHFGPNKVFVIVHDMTWPLSDHERLYSTFRGAQPTTFESAKSVYLCGKLDKLFEMSDDDAERFLNAIRIVHGNPALDQSPSYMDWIFEFCKAMKDWILYLVTSVGDALANAANSRQSAGAVETGLHTDCKDFQGEMDSALKEDQEK